MKMGAGGAVRFRWPAQRYDRLTGESIVLAVAVTAASGVAICVPVVTIYRATHATDVLVKEQPGEIVTFVHPAKPRAVDGPKPAVAPEKPGSPPNRQPVEQPLTRDTSSLTPRIAPRDLGDATAKSADRTAAPATGRAGPFAIPDRLSWVKTLSEAARDSLKLGFWSAGRFDFSTPLPPTTSQRDSAGREASRREAIAREDHRPLAIPLGGAGIPVTFLSSGKSREERRRDSVVHADNLPRLARLAERARLKRDSILAASALAGAPTGARSDSSRPRRPEPPPSE